MSTVDYNKDHISSTMPGDEEIQATGPVEPKFDTVEEKIREEVELEEIDPALDRRVRRKLDMVVMPLACLIYAMQYLDKRGISFAVIFGMQKELGLVGQEYSWAVSVFYFGQLGSNFFAMWALHKLPVRYYVGATAIIWGGVMMAQAAPKNAAGLQALRFLLGLAEGSASPAFVVMISLWYRKHEHPARFAALYFADVVAGATGGLMLYGLSSINHLAISGWRFAMLIVGGLTICIGIAFYWAVPIDAASAWFLTKEERDCAVQRVSRERASAVHKEWMWDQCWETVKSPMFYLSFLWPFLVCACTILSFGTLVISGLGFNQFMVAILQFPAAAMQSVCLGIAVLICRKYPNHRAIAAILMTMIPFLGSILLQVIPYERKWPLTGALWLTTCNHSSIIITLSIISSNTKGHTRKTLCSSIYYCGYAVGCIIGPQMFLDSEKPLYPTAMRSISGLYAVLLVSIGVGWWIFRRENKRRDALFASGVAEAEARPAIAESNDTDIQDLGFRYVL